jgi:enoyl-CoA hydratase/carnithine racemase
MSGAEERESDHAIESYLDSGAGVITLLRGEEGNRLNARTLVALRSAVREASADEEVRVILLRSNAPTFCLGMDFSALLEEGIHRRDADEAVGLYGETLQALYEAPKPVVTVVQGDVKAGGMGLIAASDIVVATEKAGFELSEVLFGLIPANVLPYLVPGRLTAARARALVLSSRRLSAEEALTAGLVDELLGAEEAEKRLKRLLSRLFKAAPVALAETKRYFHDAQYLDFDGRKAEGRAKLIDLLFDEEVRAGIRSFQEGMVPEWFAKFRPERPLLIGSGGGEKEG